MNKERLTKTDGGYSEIEMDQALDKVGNTNQVKAKSIFDSKNPPSHKASDGQKKKEKVIIKI